MIHALGWSSDEFLPNDPGRLCRGRERWIESYPVDAPPALWRTVVSGAAFSDDSARDALRGLDHSGLDPAEVILALAAGRTLFAWCEEGHVLKIPAGAVAVEEYELRRPAGALLRWSARWVLVCASAEDLRRALAGGADCFTLHDEDHPAVDSRGVLRPALQDAVFLVCGSRNDGQPERRFQPVALVDALAHSAGLILIHLDKHSTCVGLYTAAEHDVSDLLQDLIGEREVLPVPFAIPPMLARWDRAIWELRQDWDEEAEGEFPVPPAPESSWGWGRRRRRRFDEDAGGEE